MGSLTNVRTAIKATLDAETGVGGRLAGVNTSMHGGELTHEDLKRYGVNSPHLVVVLLRADIETEAGSIVARARWGVLGVTRNTSQARRDKAAIDLIDATIRTLIWSYPISTETGSRPYNVVAANEYSVPLDEDGLALWGIQFDQTVELEDVAFDDRDDLSTVHADYDLYPRPAGEDLGDVPEAEDDLTDLEL